MMSDGDPFSELLALAAQSVHHAHGLPAQLDIKPHWSGIGFSLNGCRVVAPMGEVAEILHVPPSTRLPSVQGWVRGVANVRGRLLPLIDLEAYFGGALSGSRARQRVLVLEHGELYTGLIVNHVYGMQHFPIDSFVSSIPEALQSMATFLAGGYHHNETEWSVFSPFRLARDTRFYNAAA